MVSEPYPLAARSAGDGDALPGQAARLAALRQAVARLERPADLAGGRPGAALFTPGFPAAPRLRRAALHEVLAREAGDGAAALVFALALAWRAAGEHRPLLAILERQAVIEAGRPDGHGLASLGFDPDRLIWVEARRPVEGLWAFEEGLCSGATGAVVLCVGRWPRAYDLTVSRRLTLAAAGGGVMGALAVLGGATGGDLASAAHSRWRIAARPSRPGLAGEPTATALSAELIRHRGGAPAIYDLEWSHDRRRFLSGDAPALSQPDPALPADRPGAAAGQG
jgi:protein ImuA